MEVLISYLLPVGNVTVTMLGLVVLAVLLAGVYQLGILIIRITLALDDEDAPDFVMENKVGDAVIFVVGEWDIDCAYELNLAVEGGYFPLYW